MTGNGFWAVTIAALFWYRSVAASLKEFETHLDMMH
jgi:hypothetical protein